MPAEQVVQVVLPSESAKVDGRHLAQLDSPAFDWKVPAAQTSHLAWPLRACEVPARHLVHTVDFASENWPLRQGAQLVAFAAALNVPAAQNVHVD